MAVIRTMRLGERFTEEVISPASPDCIGGWTATPGTFASNSVPNTANRSVFIPFTLDAPFQVNKAVILCGQTQSGNWDIGVYDETITKIATVGSTLQTGTGSAPDTVQIATLSVKLDRGNYFMAWAVDNVTGKYANWTSQGRQLRAWGASEKLSTFPLPAGTVVTTALTDGYVAAFGLAGQTAV
jgi:hypothetical protein